MRHRLNRGGNRQLNRLRHRIALVEVDVVVVGRPLARQHEPQHPRGIAGTALGALVTLGFVPTKIGKVLVGGLVVVVVAPGLALAQVARKLLEETRQAVSLAGRNLPSGVTLWVTNACGAATGVRIFRYPLEADVNAPVIRFDNIRAHIDPKDCATTTSSS